MPPAMLLLSFFVVLSGALLARRAFPFCWDKNHSAMVRSIGYFLCAVPFGRDMVDILVLLGVMVVIFSVLVNGGTYVLICSLYVRHMYFIVVTLFTYTYTSAHI